MKFKDYLVCVQETRPDLDINYGVPATEDTSGRPIQTSPNNCLPKDLLNQIHMRLGIVGELHELMTALRQGDKINQTEELVDQLWYVANDLNIKLLRRQLNGEVFRVLAEMEFQKTILPTDGAWMVGTDGTLGWFNAIVFNSSKLIEFNKKDFAYKREEDMAVYSLHIQYLLNAINNLAYDAKLDLEDGMDKNIAKLRARYPKGSKVDKVFTESALNRDLEAERKILEGDMKEPPHDAEERQIEHEKQFVATHPLTPDESFINGGPESELPKQASSDQPL